MAASTDPRSVLMQQGVLDRLAEIEHARWAHWQRYVHDNCRHEEDGSLVIPAELVDRWEKQIATQYAELTEAERRSDLEQVHRYLPTIISALE